jgi:hypothetical protein
MGAQCRQLRVTLRVSADLHRPTDGDHEATWLLGHTERLTFHRMWRHEEDLFARATIHVPCKLLAEDAGESRCRAWGYTAVLPQPARRRQRRQLPGDRFRIVDAGALVVRSLPTPPLSPRQLRVLEHNPCATARCSTSDHTIGAACCRDLQIEIMCDQSWTLQERLVRSRKAPLLCKVHREREDSLEAELISACGYLGADGVACTLHGRRRPDGRSAKPDLCHRWPNPTADEILHTGCVFAS